MQSACLKNAKLFSKDAIIVFGQFFYPYLLKC